MLKIKTFLWFITIAAISCNNSIQKTLIVPGVYTMHVPSIAEIISYKLETGNLLSGSKITLELNEDSTFRYGYCNRKVHASGLWRIENNNLVFHHIYVNQLNQPAQHAKSTRKIYKGFIVFEGFKDTSKQVVTHTTWLERDPTRANANDFFLAE